MMDSFKEDIVAPRSSLLGSVLYVLCWVFVVVFGLYAVMLLQLLVFSFGLGTLVMTLLSAACAVLLFLVKDHF